MKKLKTKLLFSFIFIAIFVINLIRLENPPSSKYKSETEFIGIVTNYKKSTCTQIELLGKEKLLIFDCDNNKYSYGEKLKIKGKLKRPSNTDTFNYENYLLSKNIHYIVYADKIEKIEPSNSYIYMLKNKMHEKIQNYKSKEYLNAFVLGKTDLIDENAFQSYRSNGISHLFAISGMHITLLSTILYLILNKFLSRQKSFIIISLFFIFYIFVTNFSPSVIRATFMFIILNIINSKVKSIYILLSLFLIMILINPFYLYNLGFTFSYVVTFFLITFSDLIKKQKNYFKKIFVISLISFLASLPLMIQNFNSVNFLSPLLNVIFVPLVSFIIYPFSLLTYILPFLDSIFTAIMNLFENISISLEKLDYLTFIFRDLGNINIVIYFLLSFLVLKNKKYIFVFIIIAFLHININFFDNKAFISAIDVGQGDSILIKLPNNKGNILVDTGGNPNSENKIAESRIIPYLKKEGINKINYLILTHGDYDHVGEALNLIHNYKVEKIIMNKNDNALEKQIKREFHDVVNVSKYTLNINGYILNFIGNTFEDENLSSLIIYTKIKGHHIILMGDAEKESEKSILKEYNLPNMDILKVGHHGSNTSSTEKFIGTIKPKISIISSGLNNIYGHPSKDVVLRLKEYGMVYNTAVNGTVKIILQAR